MSAPDRRGLLQRDHESLSIRRQCQLLSVARSSIYRPPRPANDNDVELMRRIDQLFTAWPFLGSRRMMAMRKMGIAALGPRAAPGRQDLPVSLAPYCHRAAESSGGGRWQSSRSVCRVARESGGLKSLQRSDEGRCIQRQG